MFTRLATAALPTCSQQMSARGHWNAAALSFRLEQDGVKDKDKDIIEWQLAT